MHRNSAPSGPIYAAAPLPAPRAEARLPRPDQSVAAEALLGHLREAGGIDGRAFSKAHSRTWVAAALAPGGCIGIDIEFRAPGRRILEIAQFLSGEPVADAAAGYRLFTFREAYFKAFGVFPDRALLLWAAGGEGKRPDFEVLYETIASDFMLTLVWTGGGVPRRLR